MGLDRMGIPPPVGACKERNGVYVSTNEVRISNRFENRCRAWLLSLKDRQELGWMELLARG